ncbi:MAG: rhodanese-like domain-containing protein [Gammaproteobacteria bacterium]
MQQLVEFSTNHVFLVSALFALLVLVIFNEFRIMSGGASVSPADAISLMNSGALVLDVRSAEQFERGHIVNARNIPAAELSDRVDSLGKYRDKPVLVCCDTGSSSGRAAGQLKKQSFAQVRSLRGGLAAWRSDNLPLETKEAVRQDKKKRKKRKELPAGTA